MDQGDHLTRRSWFGGGSANGAFDWNEISANNTYITDGIVEGDPRAERLYSRENGNSTLQSSRSREVVDSVIIGEDGLRQETERGDVQF